MDITNANREFWEFRRRRRPARVRPYVARHAVPSASPAFVSPVPRSVLHRVLDGLRALPDPPPEPHTSPARPRDERSPLVRFIDADRARRVADRTPTEELPVVALGVGVR
jgi:hypothetical protein